MQETTLQNKMHYYIHTIIIENQTNYATLCLLATYLTQACLKIQHCPFKRKKAYVGKISVCLCEWFVL
jgi:hypothetical protein